MKDTLQSDSSHLHFSLMGDVLIKKYINNLSSELSMKINKDINLIIILNGEGEISYDEIKFNYSKNNLIWFNKLCGKNLKIKKTKERIDFLYFGFSREIINDNIQLTGSKDFLSPEYMTLTTGKLLNTLILQSLYIPYKNVGSDFFILGKMMEIISLVICQLSGCDNFEENSPGGDNQIKRVKEILMQEYQEPPKLEEIANRIGINTKKLTRRFREQNGKSIYEWLQDYRLQMAYYLICCNFGNISKIASEIGYTTSHFCSIFKNKYGISPGDLKKH
ncbi:helix-turn-helix transcriptional regulator [Salmonella enterica]|uniref:AraC family transcriptional regulator n=1 Tax=Salmonella enterica I TaxID=59201 RepID=A0A8F6XVB1_SALET|nr:AraC family transcriptional regulator [Salmonella enterica]PUO48657.1 hypothetical protein DAY10_03115 [Salmonella enterica subsp. enterica]PUO58696.1 hypothetical protein DAX55_25615 [Salmonella enterica subsp. enterica]PUQ18259.1 hypothetical protein DAX99_04815 [Salmonella enterica subsp. enterica]QXR78234.1 AraC family transcriptional regulator [Salmonella enterica subsp. enterica]HAC8238621.1 AraC family transcriptional regulator [Salmonella enterica]